MSRAANFKDWKTVWATLFKGQIQLGLTHQFMEAADIARCRRLCFLRKFGQVMWPKSGLPEVAHIVGHPPFSPEIMRLFAHND